MDIDSPLERKAEEELRKTKGNEGVIPFEITLADSPKARSLIFAAELEIDQLATWLDNSQKGSKLFCVNADSKKFMLLASSSSPTYASYVMLLYQMFLSKILRVPE